MFWVPERLESDSFWTGHIPFAFWIVDALKPRRLVELGTQSGVSYCAFCQAVAQLQLPSLCTAIDTWQGDAHTGAYGEDIFRHLKPYHDAHYGGFSRLLRQCFDDGVREFADRSIDLLHIDGWHTYEAVHHDFTTWLPKMSGCGVMLFHDTCERRMDFGVWRLWEELERRYPSFLFHHSHGLGVLGVGNEFPPPLAALFAAADDERAAGLIRQRFARLGEGLSLQVRAQATGSRLDEAALQLREAQRQLAAERLRAERAEAAAGSAVFEAQQAAAQMKDAHAQASESDLARRKLKRRNKSITRSVTWKLTKPLWLLERGLRSVSGLPDDGGDGREYGISAKGYGRWIASYDRLSKSDRAAIKRHAAELALRPKISLLMPVYNTEPAHLRAAIESVRGQLYPEWELCIADDASSRPEVGRILQEQATEERIRVVRRAENGGIAAASNDALRLATGEFVAFLDHDDVLVSHALYMAVDEINRHPDADFLYSDEDHLDRRDTRCHPHFKSDWNPKLLLAQNYICHFVLYRASLLRQAGGLRQGLDGSQDWDLALRIAALSRPERIRHIPFILYHWRNHDQHSQFSNKQLAQAQEGGRRAVEDFFAAAGGAAQVTKTAEGYNRVHLPLPAMPPLVSLIIPTRDRVDLLRPCLDGILQGTRYPELEVIIVDNGSAEAATLRYFETVRADPRVRVLAYPGAFNYSAINNAAVRTAAGAVIGLVNNDIEVIGADWLADMVAWALQPEVGAVGARLLYASTRVQHGGCILGIHGSVAHAHVLLARNDPGYFARARLTQNVSAVTGACMVMRRACFEEVGGFDEVHLPIAYSDIDLCLKLRAKGYEIVYDAHAELFHHESMSRGYDHRSPEKRERQEREAAWMRERWGDALLNDPYYNPNLSLEQPFAVAFPPRQSKPWLRRQP